jgi:hypothetical protein
MPKSERRLASTQAFSAVELARANSARSSDGTRRAFSQSRATTLARSAGRDSPGGASPSGPERTWSISRPISSWTNISCRTFASVAWLSARASAPAEGIIVRSSQPSRAAAPLRS